MPPPHFLRLCLHEVVLGFWLGGGGLSAWGAAPGSEPPDLAEYRTVKTAVTTQPGPERPGAEGLAGYLGVSLSADAAGRLVVREVAPDSSAAQAGIVKGDTLLE